MLQHCEPRALFAHIVAIVLSDHIIATMALDAIVAFVILLVAL
jgi:hypothetical protein